MAERRKAMDSSMIRIICAVLALLLVGLIVLRRRKKEE
jgi:MYXO-CTERM domain-containing protein